MFKFIREAVDAVRKGNEYRREKYGEPETVAESYQRAQAYRKWYDKNLRPKTLPFFVTNQQCREIDSLKMQYQYWDGWTGGRFAREENPYINEEYFNKNHRSHPTIANVEYKDFIKHVKMGCVLRSDPVTGYWHPHNEYLGE